MSSKDLGKRMTWEEIKGAFPNQNVGLVDCIPDTFNFETAVVKYSDKEKTYSELVRMAAKGEIYLTHTDLNGEYC